MNYLCIFELLIINDYFLKIIITYYSIINKSF